MLVCKQAEKGIPLQADQSDWLADTDKEIDDKNWKHIIALWQRSRRFLLQTQELILSHWNSNTCLVEKDDSNVTPNSPDTCDNDI
ncbi:hypothetical protein Tco_1331280 [Tanacetum coccineum]